MKRNQRGGWEGSFARQAGTTFKKGKKRTPNISSRWRMEDITRRKGQKTYNGKDSDSDIKHYDNIDTWTGLVQTSTITLLASPSASSTFTALPWLIAVTTTNEDGGSTVRWRYPFRWRSTVQVHLTSLKSLETNHFSKSSFLPTSPQLALLLLLLLRRRCRRCSPSPLLVLH